VELIIVMGLLVVITVAATSMFFTMMRSATRSSNLSTLKDEGDYAMSQMEFLLRNAKKVTCSGATANTIAVTSPDNNTTTFQVLPSPASSPRYYIASSSATRGNLFLTSGSVTASPSPLTFTCSQASTTSPTFVNIAFELSRVGSTATTTSSRQQFSTSVQVRNR
jgi:Tfp pilus assembly protein PilW